MGQRPALNSPPSEIILLYIWDNGLPLVIVLVALFVLIFLFHLRTEEGVVLASYNGHFGGGGVGVAVVDDGNTKHTGNNTTHTFPTHADRKEEVIGNEWVQKCLSWQIYSHTADIKAC